MNTLNRSSSSPSTQGRAQNQTPQHSTSSGQNSGHQRSAQGNVAVTAGHESSDGDSNSMNSRLQGDSRPQGGPLNPDQAQDLRCIGGWQENVDLSGQDFSSLQLDIGEKSH